MLTWDQKENQQIEMTLNSASWVILHAFLLSADFL